MVVGEPVHQVVAFFTPNRVVRVDGGEVKSQVVNAAQPGVGFVFGDGDVYGTVGAQGLADDGEVDELAFGDVGFVQGSQ